MRWLLDSAAFGVLDGTLDSLGEVTQTLTDSTSQSFSLRAGALSFGTEFRKRVDHVGDIRHGLANGVAVGGQTVVSNFKALLQNLAKRFLAHSTLQCAWIGQPVLGSLQLALDNALQKSFKM